MQIPPALTGGGNAQARRAQGTRSSLAEGGTHEGADVLAPFRVERRISAGATPYHFAAVILVGIEVPGSRFDFDRGDLVLPTAFTKPGLILVGRSRHALEVGFRVDQQLAARCRRRFRRGYNRRWLVPPVDAGADCAIADDDAWAATVTANAALNTFKDFRIFAPVFLFVFRWARSTSVNAERVEDTYKAATDKDS
jgi:hypothetical protein